MRCPEVLVPDLLDYVSKRDSTPLLLWFGPLILGHPAFRTSVTREQALSLFDRAKLMLEAEGTGAAALEKAVGIVIAMGNRPEPEFRAFAASAWSRPLKPHVLRLLLGIAVDFKVLKPEEADTANSLSSPERDAEILELEAPLLARRDDVFISVVALFASSRSSRGARRRGSTRAKC
jgi:hypothetical protein